MSKYDHSEYQIRVGDKYVPVSLISLDEARDEICRLVDYIEKIQRRVDEASALIEEAFE